MSDFQNSSLIRKLKKNLINQYYGRTLAHPTSYHFSNLWRSIYDLSHVSKHLLFTIYQNTSYYKCIWQQRRRFYYIGITKHLTKSLSAIVALEMTGCLYVNFLTASLCKTYFSATAECQIFLLKLWPPKQNRIFKKIWPWPNYTASGRPLVRLH